MIINKILLNELHNNKNIITTARAAELGFSRTLLSNYVKNGLLERIKQGTYIMPDDIQDDMYIMMMRSKNIIFSHETALFLNSLSERTPFEYSLTIPSNTCLPATLKNECVCYYIKPEFHKIGLALKNTTFGNEVRCYNAERTICDILRSRNRIDEETVIGAIKNYASSKDKNLNLISEYAQIFKVSDTLKKYMEVLL